VLALWSPQGVTTTQSKNLIMKNSESIAKIFPRVWREYISKHKKKITFSVLCMLISAASNPINAWIIQPVLDGIFVEKDTEMLKIIPIFVLIVSVVKGFAAYGQSVLLAYLGQRIVSDMQVDLFSHIVKADLANFQKEASGNIISRFTNDIMTMRNAFTSILTSFALEIVSLIGLLFVMFYQNWQLGLIVFGVFPISILPILKIGRRTRKIARKTQHELGNFTAQLDEIFQGVRIVKAYSKEDYETTRAKNTIEKLFKLFAKAIFVKTAVSPIMEMLGGIAVAAVIWYGGFQVLEGVTTPGAFFSFMTAMLLAYKPLKSIAKLHSNMQNAIAAAIRFFSVIDTEPKIKDDINAKSLNIKGGSILFKDVSFSYGADIPAIKDISLEIEAGKTVALVGHSGSGKSTMMNLIPRFYDVGQGSIAIDGQNLKDITIESLRNSISFVSQDIVLFDDTIKANILYGKLDATDEEVIEAAKNADAHDFIMELPKKYETIIGQHGMRLSGGQRQRVSIARAMLKNSPILLMDEPTSALDPISERQVQKALERLMKDRTTLVIAHRLSTVINADMIFVLDRGEVVEADIHEELMKKDGIYCDLYKKYLKKDK